MTVFTKTHEQIQIRATLTEENVAAGHPDPGPRRVRIIFEVIAPSGTRYAGVDFMTDTSQESLVARLVKDGFLPAS